MSAHWTGCPDLANFVGVDHDRQCAAHVRQHRFPGRDQFRRRGLAFGRGVFRFGIGLGFLEEILERPQPGAALLGLVFEGLPFGLVPRLFLGRGVEFQLGQNKWSARGFLMVICSVVQPARPASADWPEMMWPCGTGSKQAMPLARVTGISSESGFTATHDSTSGVKSSPTSVVSCVARTPLISVRPSTVFNAMRPG